MRLFRLLTFLAVLSFFAVPSAPIQAADLRVTPSGGLLFEFGPFTRRGVTLANRALFEVRADGCWNSLTRIENGNDFDRSVAVYLQVLGSRGRILASVPMVPRQTVPGTNTATVNERGCSGALASLFPGLQRRSVRRVLSVR